MCVAIIHTYTLRSQLSILRFSQQIPERFPRCNLMSEGHFLTENGGDRPGKSLGVWRAVLGGAPKALAAPLRIRGEGKAEGGCEATSASPRGQGQALAWGESRLLKQMKTHSGSAGGGPGGQKGPACTATKATRP